MACAVKMLDVGGIGAGEPQLGRLILKFEIFYSNTSKTG
jgi:hypothetical protein